MVSLSRVIMFAVLNTAKEALRKRLGQQHNLIVS